MDKSSLRLIIVDQLKEVDNVAGTVPRTVFKRALSYRGSSAFVIKGVRRCGKSTLLKQLINSEYSSSFYYLNFDDERLSGFSVDDFQRLMETFIELLGIRKNVFFDEIQNVKGWELFVNRLLREEYSVFLTGSNANLLSKELGTHLTGRHSDTELYPFSFVEFLRARGVDSKLVEIDSTEGRGKVSKEFIDYFEGGGMPEAVVFSNESALLQLVGDILRRDVFSRYNIRKPQELNIIGRFLIANTGREISYRSLARNFALKSETTAQKYVSYLTETYLIFEVKRYDTKIKSFDKNPKKIYCVDNGIILKNVPTFSKNDGALLENIVAVQLKRLGREFYYFRDKNGAEVDFVVPETGEAIQVCYNINESNIEREIKSFVKVSKILSLDNVLLLTLDQDKTIDFDGLKINVKPVWRWLLETENEMTKTRD
jgi:hypothetical protein